MQTLGLSDSTPRTEGRLKSLFWPTIRNDNDVDYLTQQGFWLGFAVGVVTIVIGSLQGQPISAAFEGLFFILAGIGMRERSRVAAISAFAAYLLGAFVAQKYTGQGFSVLQIFALALLIANVRGVFLCARWAGNPDEAPLPRLTDTIVDKLVNVLPRAVWPWMRYIFVIFAVLEIGFLIFALAVPVSSRPV
jgi:hypothetical protein